MYYQLRKHPQCQTVTINICFILHLTGYELRCENKSVIFRFAPEQRSLPLKHALFAGWADSDFDLACYQGNNYFQIDPSKLPDIFSALILICPRAPIMFLSLKIIQHVIATVTGRKSTDNVIWYRNCQVKQQSSTLTARGSTLDIRIWRL